MIGALILIPALSHFLLKNVHVEVEEAAAETAQSENDVAECKSVCL
jgi:hypothetical protein